ncbi:hypothetical protein QOT17_015543 [Balamuthia mandrillaris]
MEQQQAEGEEGKEEGRLLRLPEELLLHMLRYVSMKSLLSRVSLVNSRLYALSQDDSLWRGFYGQYWGSTTSSLRGETEEEPGWKAKFKQRVLVEQNYMKGVALPTFTLKPGKTLHSLRFDETVIGVGSQGLLSIFNRETGEQISERVLESMGQALAFDERRFVVGTWGGAISIFSRESLLRASHSPLRFEEPASDRLDLLDAHHRSSINHVRLWRDTLITGSSDAKIKIWQLEDAIEKTPECKEQLSPDAGAVRCLHERLSSGDTTLVAGTYDKTVLVFDLTTKQCITKHQHHTYWVRAVQFDDQKIVSCSMDGYVVVYDRRSREHVIVKPQPIESGAGRSTHAVNLECMQYDSFKAVFGGTGKCVHVLDWRTMRFASSLPPSTNTKLWCLQHDGATLMTGGTDGATVRSPLLACCEEWLMISLHNTKKKVWDYSVASW